MRIRTMFTSLVAAAGSLALVAPVVAGPGPGGGRGWGGPDGGGGRGQHHQRVIESADLDPETAARVEAIFAGAHASHRGMREQMRELDGQLVDLLSADQLDIEAIEEHVEAVASAHAAAARMRAATLIEVRSAVTSDEWVRLSEALREKRGRGGMGRPHSK